MAQVLKSIKFVGGEQLRVAYTTAIAPAAVAGDPCKGVCVVGLCSDNFRDSSCGQGLVVFLEDFFGSFGGGSDDGGDGAEAESHEWAMEFG